MEPSLLLAEQPQLSQPFFLGEVFQPSDCFVALWSEVVSWFSIPLSILEQNNYFIPSQTPDDGPGIVNSRDHPIGSEDKTWKSLIPSAVPQDHSGRSFAIKPCYLAISRRAPGHAKHTLGIMLWKTSLQQAATQPVLRFCTLNWNPLPHTHTQMVTTTSQGYRQQVAPRTLRPVDIPSPLWRSWTWQHKPLCWGRQLQQG